MKTKIEQRHRKKAVQVASCLNWDDWASYAKTNYLEGIERLAEIFADFEQERLVEAKELLQLASPIIEAASENAELMGDLDEIRVTLSLDDWKLLVAYFEGNVEAMGDNAPELQPQARRIQNTMRRAIVLGELKTKT